MTLKSFVREELETQAERKNYILITDIRRNVGKIHINQSKFIS